MKLRPALLLLATLATTLLPATAALACSLGGPAEHVLSEEERAVDTQTPTTIQRASTSITRGQGTQFDGCGAYSTSCDDLGFLSFKITGATDDRTPPAQLGYLIVLAEGSLPDDLYLPAEDGEPIPLRADASGGITLTWIDGATDDQESIDFTVEIFPMDLAGNVGEPIRVRVCDDQDSFACSVAPRRTPPPSNALTWGALGLGILAAARRW